MTGKLGAALEDCLLECCCCSLALMARKSSIICCGVLVDCRSLGGASRTGLTGVSNSEKIRGDCLFTMLDCCLSSRREVAPPRKSAELAGGGGGS